MTEFQNIALGLLGMSHPETQVLRQTAPQERAPGSRPGALSRALKFAFAALFAGSRAIPLGDNGCVTRELANYGAQLRIH